MLYQTRTKSSPSVRVFYLNRPKTIQRLRQAIAMLKSRHPEIEREDGDYEWACFAAQQGAEKAVKAVFQKIGAEAWGHSVTVLLEALPNSSAFESELLEALT